MNRFPRLVLVSAIVILGASMQGCWGTSGTGLDITNTCGSSYRFRLTGRLWDRSRSDQLRGSVIDAGQTFRLVAIDPPNSDEQLVLRISDTNGTGNDCGPS